MPTTPTSTTTPTSEAVARAARRQRSLLRQALRFVVLNLKIFRLTRQHH